MTQFMAAWRPYNALWRNEKTPRELLTVSLTEFESMLRKHSELFIRLGTEQDIHIIGSSLAISTEKLKFGLHTEIKSLTHKLVKFSQIIYKC